MMETVSGTNMQMEMVSPTHKCMMEMVSGTNVQSYRPSHTANTYLSYLLIVLQKNKLFRKKRKKTYCHDNDNKYFKNKK